MTVCVEIHPVHERHRQIDRRGQSLALGCVVLGHLLPVAEAVFAGSKRTNPEETRPGRGLPCQGPPPTGGLGNRELQMQLILSWDRFRQLLFVQCILARLYLDDLSDMTFRWPTVRAEGENNYSRDPLPESASADHSFKGSNHHLFQTPGVHPIQ